MSIVAVLVCSVVVIDCADAEGQDFVMFDGGNGDTQWAEAGTGTYGEVLKGALEKMGHELISDDDITVDGRATSEIGNTTCSWRIFSWNGVGWDDVTSSVNMDDAYRGTVAVGFYPEGTVPTETPVYKSSWTMIRGDSGSTGHQYTEMPSGEGSYGWQYTYGNSYVNGAVLTDGKYAFVNTGGNYTSAGPLPTLYCYDRETGKEVWKFEYAIGAGYETSTGVLYGGNYYLPASQGALFKIPVTGPGDDNEFVKRLSVSNTREHDVVGNTYSAGPASLVYDSGMLYFSACNANAYCVDMDLNVVWETPLGGCVYFVSPTVHDGVMYTGALNGHLYTIDQKSGEILQDIEVYTETEEKKNGTFTHGGVNTPSVVGDMLYVTFNDGSGMNTVHGGIAGYRILSTGLEEAFKEMEGVGSSMVLPVETEDFQGVYWQNQKGLVRTSADDATELIATYDDSFKAPLVLVNDQVIFASSYNAGGNVYAFDLSGKVLGTVKQPDLVANYCMSPVVVIDGMFMVGTDGGVFAYSGSFFVTEEEVEEDSGMVVSGWTVTLIVFVLLILLFIAYLFHIKKTKKMPPFAYIRMSLKQASGFNNDRTSKVKKNKRRLATVLIIGSIGTVILFLASLAYGPSGNYSLGEALGYFTSALEKTFTGGALTYDETIIFDSRGSRATAAFAVGLGLSISGCIYQAIIRNPMVDPYIMGVSAGAGVAAVATIAFNFTFFGLLDSVTYTTPIVAMVGGLLAFGATMLLAEKSGGSSVNYVLAGIIVGLVFSAAQTLMLSMAGDKLNSAMQWLFGSFANINWDMAILVLIPAVTLSLVPMVWAKEFNLVLLGEDQAKQMGLDVKRFNRWMLILASLLASICVAFVGIIGFVGLVVPHVCRMILGGDHRLVMPASIVLGAAMMLAADLFSKMILVPMELPVGAITTVIGAPVFAYLLIKKGRMYDG